MIVELISTVGLMWILKHGSILNAPRNFLTKRSAVLHELFNCSLCLGFWCGIFIGLLMFYFREPNILYLLFPLCSSALCWFFDSLLDLIQLAACFLDKKS